MGVTSDRSDFVPRLVGGTNGRSSGEALAAGTEPEKTALRCFLATPDAGLEELLARESVYWESNDSWISILVRRLRKRGNFTSTENLREKIVAFIGYFDNTVAQPFKWTYTDRPLNV